MSDAGAIPVTFTVQHVEHVRRAGRLLGLACVELDVAGVLVVLRGVSVIQEPAGDLVARPAGFRHPVTRRWHTSVTLPPELARAIGGAVLRAFVGLPPEPDEAEIDRALLDDDEGEGEP